MKKIDTTTAINYALAIFLAGLFLFFSYARVFDEFEYSTLDFRYRVRPARNVDENIVIVEIGDDTIEKLGKWPLPRNYHGLLVKALKYAGVKTVIFDVFFSEAKEEDEAFADAVEKSDNVYMSYVLELDRTTGERTVPRATEYAAPLVGPLKEAARDTGFVNIIPDMDGKVRRVPPFIEMDGEYYPHITFLAVLNDMGYEFDEVDIIPGKEIIVSEEIRVPLTEESAILVDYPDSWGDAFRHYSYVDIIQSYLADVMGKETSIDLKELEGSTAMIGMTATASPDAHPSPMEPMYPGIGVHASLYNSMLQNSFLMRLNRWWNLLILLLMWIFTAYVTTKAKKRFAILSILLIIFGYTFLAVTLFVVFGIWMDIFYPIVTVGGIYMLFTFRKYVTESQRREVIEKELNIASDIQQSFLPKDIPQVGGIEVDTEMLTARQVGGDLYDIVELDDSRLGIMLGDVSGKGVPAALYMAKVVSVFRTFIKDGTPAEVLKKVNNRLVAESGTNLFVTLTYMIFDTKTHTTEFAIGGHLPTILVTPGGDVELLDVAEGMPLGLIDGEFSPGDKKYEKGSIFILYSDGVTEAMNVNEDMFSEERLVNLCKGFKGIGPQEIVRRIQKAVLDFAGRAKQHDDITVMAIKT
ncbi:CHASE2 domain-containing protein [Candidatus Omnitrophota bacterium]